MYGKMVEFKETNDGLEIILLPEGKEELDDMFDGQVSPNKDLLFWKKPAESIFLDLIEYQLGNGWSVVNPEDVGALTDGLLLSPDAEYNDHGELVAVDTVYWDSNYQVESLLDELYVYGKSFMVKG